MNTYSKYCPNVFVAKCTETHEKGDTIILETKYGKENECIVFNLVDRKDDHYYYSIVRADGFNVQEWAKRKAERLKSAGSNAEKKSNEYYEASKEGKDFLVLAEPIKIGHHSEKRHRALIERNHNRMKNSMEYLNKAADYQSRSEYWEGKASTINLSMPESLEFYEYKLEEAKEKHEGLKSGKYERRHSYSLTYAKKAVNEALKNFETALKLWGE
jgi:hypothetical protein